MKLRSKRLLALALGILFGVADSQQPLQPDVGANISACVYSPESLTPPVTVNITVGGGPTQCMSTTGSNVTFTYTDAGVTCASVGFMELNNTRGCLLDPSYWFISYETAFGPPGATNTRWRGLFPLSIELIAPSSPGTNICGGPGLCGKNTLNWPRTGPRTKGPFYVSLIPFPRLIASSSSRLTCCNRLSSSQSSALNSLQDLKL